MGRGNDDGRRLRLRGIGLSGCLIEKGRILVEARMDRLVGASKIGRWIGASKQDRLVGALEMDLCVGAS